MTFPFDKIPIPFQGPRRLEHPPLVAAWSRDPQSGKLIQIWREPVGAEASAINPILAEIRRGGRAA